MILHAIAAYAAAHGRWPSQVQIAAAVGRGRTTMPHHLRWLEEDGLVERRAGEHHNIRLTDAGRGWIAEHPLESQP